MLWLRRNWFVVGIVVALTAGFFIGRANVELNPAGITSRAVVLILFLIIGLTLPTNRIRQDLNTPKLHLMIQLFIFAVAPALFLTARIFFRDAMDGQLLVGIYALAVLPTTVSSCIVFTQSSGGNTVAAVFNASFANTLGIVVSPLLLSLMLTDTAVALPPGQLWITLRGLLVNMLAPIVAGQVVRIPVREFVDNHRKKLGITSNALILVVVVLAFSRTAANPEISLYVRDLPWMFIYLGVVHLVLVILVLLTARVLRLKKPDVITAMFVAPQKTLALGAPLLTLFFTGQAVLGVALLPLVFYHPFQLLVAGALKSLPFVKEDSP